VPVLIEASLVASQVALSLTIHLVSAIPAVASLTLTEMVSLCVGVPLALSSMDMVGGVLSIITLLHDVVSMINAIPSGLSLKL